MNRSSSFILRLALTACLLLFVGSISGNGPGVHLPDGFQIQEIASSALVNDIHAMTFDAKGRLVVAGRRYIRILEDDNSDGVADRAIDFSPGPFFGAMGLWWEDDSLLVTDDSGLYRYFDRDRNDKADGPPEEILRLSPGAEHGFHAIRRGPDDGLYVIAGDSVGVSAKHATSLRSPIRNPVGGCLLRFTPDLKQIEIVADGFRNAYDFDFDPTGEIFTYDSDNERCVSLPWYEPTRFYHLVPGGHHGWQARTRAVFWRMPPWFPDIVPPVCLLGRGSPTGVACYRHMQFPAHYRGGFFALDWTFGRVYFIALEARGSTFSGQPENFIEAKGNDGFAPTDVLVHPETGDLLLSIGGRGTRGAIYRVRYAEGYREDFDAVEVERLQPTMRDLETMDLPALAAMNASPSDAPRFRRALELMARFHDEVDPGRMDKAVREGIGHADRLVRQAASRVRALQRNIKSQRPAGDEASGREDEFPLLALAHLDVAGVDGRARTALLVGQLSDFLQSQSDEEQLSYVRAAQQLAGDLPSRSERGRVWEGYSPREENASFQPPAAMFSLFPTGRRAVDFELARLAALIRLDELEFAMRLLGMFTSDSDPIDDIHYLVCLARQGSPPSTEETIAVASALLSLDQKLDKRGCRLDRHWPMRMMELHAGLSQRDPRLNDAILHGEFGRPEHLVWTHAKGFDRPRAARVFFERVEDDETFPWSPELVRLLGELEDDVAFPVLRRRFNHLGVRGAILAVLSRRPMELDRLRFIEGLTSPDVEVIASALRGLEGLPQKREADLLERLIAAVNRLPSAKASDELRSRLLRELSRQTGESFSSADEWLSWFGREHPDRAARLSNGDGVDRAAWEKRLESIDWKQGEPRQGKAAFARLGCALCHTGSFSLGPDLAGVSKRFSRQDLLDTVIEPSREVSDRYRTTMVLTTDGRSYQGMVIYEAADSLLLQVSPTETVRIMPDEIAEQSSSPRSLMPSGLLDKLDDPEIADLFAYLQTL